MRVTQDNYFGHMLSSKHSQIMKIKGASVSLCKTPPEIFINSVSPSSVLTIDLVFLYAIMISLIISSGIQYALSISAIFPRCMESKALEKSMKRIVAVRFDAFTPSINLLTVMYFRWISKNIFEVIMPHNYSFFSTY